MSDLFKIKRALLSVSDKSHLVDFAKRLAKFDIQLISTGGTARLLAEAGLDVTPVEQITDFPEMMDGRVKTLHPKIHGGLLALRDNPEHVSAMTDHDIQPIDLVCINLYPFEQTIAKPHVAFDEAIEQIDIGGPSMVRSGAKNHGFVTVVTDPAQYTQVADQLEANDGATTLSLRRQLAAAAFTRTAEYDTIISTWMNAQISDSDSVQDSASDDSLGVSLGESIDLKFKRLASLRYGENPHQAGALYADPAATEPSVTQAKQLHGKQLSFNNLYDANGALELVKEIDAKQLCAAAVIKHANPCGFGVGADVAQAFDHAYQGDPLAAFGGIVAFNCPVTKAAAQRIVDGKKFLEVIIAPRYDADALELLSQRWKNVRILETGDLPGPDQRSPAEFEYKKITAGLLVQERDLASFDTSAWEHKAGPAPSDDALLQMRIAMIVVKHLKSNAVCLVRNSMLVGAGAGQMDRLASCSLSITKAADRAQGAYAGSDAFFPFRDGPDSLIKAGVAGIVQPGGSKRDDETIAACNESDVTLMFTGRRHFRH
jgi:phosphoribosylaminoimidazolecarboxamide formyltransferase/IMP cyclohydrolase